MPFRLRPRPVRARRGTPPASTLGPRHGALVPAAARVKAFAAASRTEQHAALNEHGVDIFLKAVGGRGKLLEVLTVASAEPEVDAVVDLLSDPRYERMSIKKLCTLTGTPVSLLFGAYRKGLLAKAHIEAASIIADKLPPIVADVMERATPQPMLCSHCAGEDALRAECLFCKGTGIMRSEPELERQKLALELGHLTQKGGGVTVNQQQGIVTAGGHTVALQGPGALEQLHQAVGELLFSPGRRRSQSPQQEPDTLPAYPVSDPPDPLGPADPEGPPLVEDEPDHDDADDDDKEDDTTTT